MYSSHCIGYAAVNGDGHATCMLLILHKCSQPSDVTGVVIDVVHLWNFVLARLSSCTHRMTEMQGIKHKWKEFKCQAMNC